MLRRWLSPQGRIGRAAYWWRYLLPVGTVQCAMVLLSLVVWALLMGTQLLRIEEWSTFPDGPLNHEELEMLAQLSLADLERAGTWIWRFQAVALALMVPMLAGAAKRWRDIGQSGWWALLLLVPGLGFALAVILGFLRGRPVAS